MKNGEATGLYGWIQSNDGKSTVLFVSFLIAIQVVSTLVLFLPLMLFDPDHGPFFNWSGYLIRYAPLVLIGSIVWFAWKMFWHIETVKQAVGFEFVDAQDEPRLCRIIEPLITISGLPVPFVGLIEDEARNAFACGVGRKKAVIVVTRGLLDALDDEELANVLGHEISHIKHGDIRLMAAANIFLHGLSHVHQNNPLRFTPIHFALAIGIPAILPLSLAGGFIGHIALRAGQVARLILSSSREFIADAEAVQLTKNPAALASALLKVEQNYRVGSARSEDDAMMIAGDTQGNHATHPTVAQRIAALARTTGSLVFNAPGAVSNQQTQTSFSYAQAESAALLQRLPPARVLARVRAESKDNFLGLSKVGTIMAILTIIALLWIHAAELTRPSTLLAKFDMRPLSAIVGVPFACQVSPFFEEAAKRCGAHNYNEAYAELEGQENTLAGWLAVRSEKRKKEDLAAQVKKDVAVAKLNQTGCFHAPLIHNDPDGYYKTDREIGGASMARYVSLASGSAQESEHDTIAASDKALLGYVDIRINMVRASYDLFGIPGLRMIQTEYQRPPHIAKIHKLGVRLADPRFSDQLDAVTRTKIVTLINRPQNFVPCLSIQHGALG